MKRFLRIGFALTGGAQLFYAGASMVGGILVARALGPQGRGTISVLMAVGALSVLLASLGVYTSSIYFIGRFKEDRDAVISNATLAGLAGGVITAVILAAVGMAFHEHLLPGISIGLFLVFVLSVPFNYFNEFESRTALGIGRVGLMNLPLVVGGGSLAFGTAAVLAIFGHDLLPLVILRVATEGVVAVVLFVAVRRITAFAFKPSRRLFGRQVRYGVRNYSSALLWAFLLQSDILLLNHFVGTGETGVYSVAVSLGLPVTVLAAALGTLVFQRVSAEESPRNRVEDTNRLLRMLVPVAALATIGIGVAAPWLIPAVYGDAFGDAVGALELLLPGLFVLTLEIVLMNFLAGEGAPSIVYRAPLVGLTLNFCANLYVIPRWGIDGAAVTSTIAYTLVFLVVARFYLRWTESDVAHAFVLRRADIAVLRNGMQPPARSAAS
jgi:O-antigen/teichoic acid export membrane protein